MQKLLLHITIWLVAVSVLNSSIQTPDVTSIDFGNCTEKQLTGWNEFETVYEWVAEEVFDIKNAVPENYKTQSNENLILKKHTPDFTTLQFEQVKVEHASGLCILVVNCDGACFKPISGYKTLYATPPRPFTCA